MKENQARAAFALVVIVVALLFVASSLSGKLSSQEPPQPTPGRYAIAVAERPLASYVLLLDTATGEVWAHALEVGTWPKGKTWNAIPRR